MMRHWQLRLLVVVVVVLLLLLLLLVELGLHVAVLGFVLPVVSVLLGRDSSVLAHDAAAGSLWVVEEGGHHGGGPN